MEQEIALSDKSFSFLFQNFTYGTNETSRCMDILSDNYIIDDEERTIFKLLEKILTSIDHTQNEKLKIFKEKYFDYWLFNCRKKIPGVFEKDWNNEIIKLCQASKDKILFDPLIDVMSLELSRLEYEDVEIHNLCSFLNPRFKDRLKNLPFILTLQHGDKYDLNFILLPFVRNATNITIIDPYIANKINFTNFKKFSKILPKLTNCKIKKLKLESDHPTAVKNDKIFNDYIETLKEDGYSIQIEFFKSPKDIPKRSPKEKPKKVKHKDRYIITDKYEIYLPGGFDCLDEEGYANVTGENEDIKNINISKKSIKINLGNIIVKNHIN